MDGTAAVVPPWIIHKACNLAEIHLLNLPPDWGVHCSESGYMDEQAWVALCKHFVANIGALRPQYVFIDGYWAHLVAEGLRVLLEASVHPFILKSQDSERDQVW